MKTERLDFQLIGGDTIEVIIKKNGNITHTFKETMEPYTDEARTGYCGYIRFGIYKNIEDNKFKSGDTQNEGHSKCL